jgi:predicted kinase
MSDAAFLAMDLEAHGRGDLAFRFLDAFLASSGDYGGVRVLRFHAVYRALVRALVSRLTPGEPTTDYIASAMRWANGAAARLLVTHGVSGSGKSTLAAGLLEHGGAIRVRSDVERKRLFGLAALQSSTGGSRNPYDEEASRRTYRRLAWAARAALEAGFPAIVDATFLHKADRAAFRRLATSLGVPFNILVCSVDAGLLRQRLERRQRAGLDPSEATAAVLDMQLKSVEPLTRRERFAAIEACEVGDDADRLAQRWLHRA